MADPAYPHIERTIRRERRRAFCTGIVTTAPSSLLLLVGERHFHAGDAQLAAIASLISIGLLLSPWVLRAASTMRLPVSRASAIAYLAASAGAAVAALVPGFPAYLGGLLVALPLVASTAPLSTALWRQNAPDHLRGRLYSGVVWATTLGALAGQSVMAWWIRDDASRYPPLVGLLSVALLCAAGFAWRVPSLPVPRKESSPLHSLTYLWRDPLFGYVSAAWMFLGIGNLAVLPLRVKYVAAQAYGLAYPEWRIMILVGLVPILCQLGSTPFWGRCFDRMNFITLRMILNMGFAASSVLFFVPSWPVQIVASAILGVSLSGGSLAWNLWVTLYAPPERTAAYMSVHTFLTGLRGIVAPALAFHALRWMTIRQVAWACAASCLVSVAMLGFELLIDPRRGARRTIDVPPVPE